MMTGQEEFAGCCGAQIPYGFQSETRKSIAKTLSRTEKWHTGIIVVILNHKENELIGATFKKRGWESFCAGTVNPNTRNKLYGYAFAASTAKAKKKTKPRKSLFVVAKRRP